MKTIKISDNKGYLFFYTFKQLKKVKTYKKFSRKNPFTVDNIKLWLVKNNKQFILLSKNWDRYGSKLKWKCLNDECQEEFEMLWTCVFNQNQGCPFCTGRQVGKSNCLATKNPNLAKEWHPTKNGDLTPWNVTISNSNDIWWRCLKNSEHEWKTSLHNRNKNKSNCPFCAGQKATKENNLKVVNPKICEEWNYEKNKSIPEDYCPNSNKVVWWKCKLCGHEWKHPIVARNYYGGCPNCNESAGEREILMWLGDNKAEFIKDKKFDGLVGMRNRNLTYDFYLPDFNLLIEYQGQYHDGSSGFFSKKRLTQQRINDEKKREYARLNKISLIEIWHWDFYNIKEILDNTLFMLRSRIRQNDLRYMPS